MLSTALRLRFKEFVSEIEVTLHPFVCMYLHLFVCQPVVRIYLWFGCGSCQLLSSTYLSWQL